MRYIIYAFLVVNFLAACQQASPKKKVVETGSAVASVPTPNYPSIPRETMEMLWSNCTNIDLIFTSLPYSVSTNSNQESRPLLMHISTDAAFVDDKCPMIASVVYLSNGKIVLESNLYYSSNQQCQYMVFLENGQPKYANYLSQQGKDYFNQLFNTVKVNPQ
jgi:hypothetical protein